MSPEANANDRDRLGTGSSGADATVAWAMVESSPDALVVVDESGLIELVNAQAEALFGCARESMLGQPVEILLPERLGRSHVAHRARFQASPGVRPMGSDLQLSARRADGSEIPVEVSLSPLIVDGQRRVIAAVRDSSERVAAEARLRRSEERFRSAFGDGPVPMTIAEVSPTADRVIREANQAMADLVGYPLDDLIGMSFVDITHPDDLEFDDAATKAMERGEYATFMDRKRYIRRDGSVVWVQVHVAIVSREGAALTTIGHAVDITTEIEATDDRIRQESFSRAISTIRLAMLRGASRSEGLRLICRSAADCLNAGAALILTQIGGGEELGIEASFGVPAAAIDRLSFTTDLGGPGEVFRTGRPVFGMAPAHPDAVASNRAIVQEYGVTSILTAPLPDGDNVVGALVVVRQGSSPHFTADDLAPIEDFASTAVAAIHLAAVRDAQALLDITEDRERIGRDMHDKVIGQLFATGMGLQSILGRIEDNSVHERISGAVEEIDAAIREIRTAVYGVRSRRDWGRGKRGQILALAADWGEVLGFEPTVTLDGPIDELPIMVFEGLAATTREALTNIGKHAQASSTDIRILATNDGVALTIIDDGVGLTDAPPADGSELTNKGLANIMARATELGGRADITSEPNEGTRLTWTVPTSRIKGAPDSL